MVFVYIGIIIFHSHLALSRCWDPLVLSAVGGQLEQLIVFISLCVCIVFFHRHVSSEALLGLEVAFLRCHRDQEIRWGKLPIVSVLVVEALLLVDDAGAALLLVFPALRCGLSKDLAALAASLVVVDIRWEFSLAQEVLRSSTCSTRWILKRASQLIQLTLAHKRCHFEPRSIDRYLNGLILLSILLILMVELTTSTLAALASCF